jgi:RNA polymerase sigma-70 factor (ECF subfamily)
MARSGPAPPSPPDPGSGLESTSSLLDAIRRGDPSARDRLISRYWARLRGWAHGRVPAKIRDLNQTDDLVQITFLRALDHLTEFDNRREGAFLAFLRTVFLNLVRDEIRKKVRQPQRGPLSSDLRDGGESPLERAIGRELVERYEEALLRLPDEQREAVILRVEMGFTYPEVAAALEIREPNTARMRVARGLARLAELMDDR